MSLRGMGDHLPTLWGNMLQSWDLTAVIPPLAVPGQCEAAVHHGAAYIATFGRYTPGRRTIVIVATSRQAPHSRTTDKNMPMR